MIVPVKLAYIIISTKRICIIIVSKQTCTYVYLLLYNCNRSVMDSRVFPRELPLGVSNFASRSMLVLSKLRTVSSTLFSVEPPTYLKKDKDSTTPGIKIRQISLDLNDHTLHICL